MFAVEARFEVDLGVEGVTGTYCEAYGFPVETGQHAWEGEVDG